MTTMVQEETPRTRLESIAGWKLGKTLGRGAYAHVRMATSPDGTQVACKILPALHGSRKRSATQDETMDAIEAHKEVVLLKGLAGAGLSGIVGLEGVIEQDGWTYVFLALHQNSASRFSDPSNRDSLIVFFRHLCLTIQNLHLLGISHEDIKRSNILVDKNCWPVVVDFGFSHFNPDNKLVKSAGGTLDYSSPEKVQDLLYDPRAIDVWALGILLLKMLGLPHPFMKPNGQGTSEDVKKRIVFAELLTEEWSRLDPSGKLEHLLRRMLDKDPSRRITIQAVLRHPFLHTTIPDNKAFRPPSLRLPIDFPRSLPTPVLEDVCFLAFVNKDFFLCESPNRIKNKILGKQPCWEKRWAGFFNRWNQKEELILWEDVPTRDVQRAISEPTKARQAANHGRALREIHLSPDVAKIQDPKKPAAVGNTPLAKAAETQAAPRRGLINQMKPKDGSISSNTIRSTIHVQADTPQKAVKKEKKPGTPVRVDFGRKKPAVLMPKLALNRQNIPPSAVDVDQQKSSYLPKYGSTDLGSEVPATKPSQIERDKSKQFLEEREISETGISELEEKGPDPNREAQRNKDVGGRLRRSRRIQDKENRHGC